MYKIKISEHPAKNIPPIQSLDYLAIVPPVK